MRDAVKLRRDPYRGSKPALQQKAADNNRLASRIESYLEAQRRDGEENAHMVTFDKIARDLRESEEAVRRAMRGAGGHHGITF